ncbi:short chain dehydrogenase domain-containing protein [Ditylenchus destructor]|uniref:Short chain dehydrogenase domain-containing protein n=1 Tax=Ditylenchus destructor TaxID=166010 RepID=A0AAD4QWN1_9BILA|nr:short chain dehydrogenase domain-containing protein [Ditylenchus destructor]
MSSSEPAAEQQPAVIPATENNVESAKPASETENTTASPAEPVYHRKYGSRTSALEVLKDLDLTGKTILITGTTSGIGIETARSLALKGAHVVIANRNIVQSEQQRDNIYKETDKHNIDIINMDLSSLQSVQAAAKEFISKGWPLHVLILNAGILTPPTKTTLEGHEATFGVNHLGHFYLAYLLMDKLREAAPSRLVVVSSNSHQHTGIDVNAPLEAKLTKLIPQPNTSEFAYRLYAYSKLCNVLFALKVHNDEYKNGIHTYVLHPGSFIATGISRTYGVWGKIGYFVSKPFTKNLQQGAATTVYCAVHPDVENDSGKYYESCWDDEKNLATALAHDKDLQDALWAKSVELVKKFEEEEYGAVLDEEDQLNRLHFQREQGTEEDGFYRIGTDHGILSQQYSRNQIEPSSSQFISNENVPDKEISLRAAVGADSLSGGQGHKHCNCVQGCKTRKCNCRSLGRLCNSRCHNSTSCKNK